ncbi:MAG: SagB/ThcOx family dehydrogenase [Aeropyrum sp.]|nr:SagB/ThcOx family dehydrogenase [Aeropyrum sp.]
MGGEESCESILTRLKRMLDPSVWARLQAGLEAAASSGDPAMIYHEVSKLDRSYYGGSLARAFPGYFKRYEGAVCTRLPPPLESSGVDVLMALRSRRSRREYSGEPLSLGELSTILYYTLGIVGRAWWGGPKRPYPSAGALQPIEAYIFSSAVDGLEEGLYHYYPPGHCLERLGGQSIEDLYRASLEQEHVAEAAAAIVLTAVYARTASKYGNRSYRYVHWDAGFAGQNVYLVCEALGLATVAVGAFYDEELCSIIGLDCREEIPMLVFPIGRRV